MPRSNRIADNLLLIGSLGLWAACGAFERNWFIPAFATVAFLCGIACSLFVSRRKSVLYLFVTGYALRSIVCLLAWHQSRGTGFEFWTGLNEDSNRYYINSYLGFRDAVQTTEDPGFPIVNSAITWMAAAVGEDHYLVNVQIPLVAGALFAVAVYAVGKEITDDKTASIAAWMIALNPIAVGWSTGLMRDTVVATLGWLMVYFIGRTLGSRRAACWVNLTMAVVSGLLGWWFRSVSCVYLIVVALILNVFNHKPSRGRAGINILFLGFGLALTCLLGLSPAVRDRIHSVLAYGQAGRDAVGTSATAINSGGLSEKIADSNSLGTSAIFALYIFLAPFPVYWSPTDFDGNSGRLVDYLMNVGGLANLALLPYCFAGLYCWWRSRQYGNFIVAGPLFYLTCFAFMLGTSQSRWLMAFSYPLYYITAAKAISVATLSVQTRRLMLVLATLIVLLVYSSYWLLKSNVPLMIIASSTGLMLVAALVAILLLYRLMFANEVTSSRLEH